MDSPIEGGSPIGSLCINAWKTEAILLGRNVVIGARNPS